VSGVVGSSAYCLGYVRSEEGTLESREMRQNVAEGNSPTQSLLAARQNRCPPVLRSSVGLDALVLALASLVFTLLASVKISP
jgi:hypothetical protein